MKEELFNQAKKASIDYKYGRISREEAQELCQPYIDLVNATSKRIAKEYGVTPRYIDKFSFLR